MLPVPQTAYRIVTLEEYASKFDLGDRVDIPNEVQISYLLEIIKILNLGMTDEGYELLSEDRKALFKKRDDVYYDEQHRMYFLKEEKKDENPK